MGDGDLKKWQKFGMEFLAIFSCINAVSMQKIRCMFEGSFFNVFFIWNVLNFFYFFKFIFHINLKIKNSKFKVKKNQKFSKS
jgi:hypothetical protein